MDIDYKLALEMIEKRIVETLELDKNYTHDENSYKAGFNDGLDFCLEIFEREKKLQIEMNKELKE